MNKKNLFIITLLFLHVAQCLAMEQEDPADHCLANQESKDDGYDKQISQNKNNLAQAATLALMPKIKKFQCSLCPKYLNFQKKNVRCHILKNHPDKPEVRIIEISPEGLAIRSIKVKNLGKIYFCSQCDKTMRDPYYFKIHRKLHGEQSNSTISYDYTNINDMKSIAQTPDLSLPNEFKKKERMFCETCGYSIKKTSYPKHIKSQNHQDQLTIQTLLETKTSELSPLPDLISLATQIDQLNSHTKELVQIFGLDDCE